MRTMFVFTLYEDLPECAGLILLCGSTRRVPLIVLVQELGGEELDALHDVSLRYRIEEPHQIMIEETQVLLVVAEE